MAITIGAGAIDRDSITSSTITFIDLTSPASNTGTITSVQVWAATNMADFYIGIFFLVSGTTYQCRSSANIGDVTAGEAKTFAVSLAVTIGDFIGCYLGSGQLEKSTAGGSGIRFTTGNHTEVGDQTNFSNFSAAQALSLYGTGAGSPPTVTSATPNSAARTETKDIVLGGTKFTGATSSDFGANITITSTTVDSDTQVTSNITITFAAALGTRDVSVTTPDGTGTFINGFTVEDAPVVGTSGAGANFTRREVWRGSGF